MPSLAVVVCGSVAPAGRSHPPGAFRTVRLSRRLRNGEDGGQPDARDHPEARRGSLRSPLRSVRDDRADRRAPGASPRHHTNAGAGDATTQVTGTIARRRASAAALRRLVTRDFVPGGRTRAIPMAARRKAGTSIEIRRRFTKPLLSTVRRVGAAYADATRRAPTCHLQSTMPRVTWHAGAAWRRAEGSSARPTRTARSPAPWRLHPAR